VPADVIGVTIRVVTWNVNDRVRDTSQQAEFLASIRPDLLLLQVANINSVEKLRVGAGLDSVVCAVDLPARRLFSNVGTFACLQ
jgi:hypothetical protein